jgi:hypothetical protein
MNSFYWDFSGLKYKQAFMEGTWDFLPGPLQLSSSPRSTIASVRSPVCLQATPSTIPDQLERKIFGTGKIILSRYFDVLDLFI